MKQLTLVTFFILSLFFNPNNLSAEGTASLAPSLADEAALFIGAGNTGSRGGDYGQFAWKDSDSKLYFNVQNSCEKVYIGFSDPINDRSFSRVNGNGGSGIERDLIFRIIDPTGNPINNLACFGNTTINGEVWQTLNEFTSNITNRIEADNGPNQLGAANGYDAFVLDLAACGINLTGNYSIEFYTTDATYNPNSSSAGFYIPYFDITVANCSNQGMTGRVWSNNWGIGIKRDGDGPFDRAFNGSLFVCSTEGFITKIDFNTGINTRAETGKDTDQRSGFRAGAFNISMNRSGPGTSGDIITDRQSVQNANLTNPLLPVFLNLPDEAFCPVQEIGEIKAAANFLTGCPEDRCINIAATQPGQFEIIIEGANGNGILDQPSERSLLYIITDADKVTNPETPDFIYEACIPWDGKDGNGNTLLEVAITITGNYFQGIYHFPVYDAEFNDDGFIVETVRPSLGRQLLYYDDTNITELNNTAEPKDGTNGCVGPCHRWTGEWEDYTNADDIFGNFNTINTWWFASTSSQDLTGALGALEPLAINCPDDYNGCTQQSIAPATTGEPTINFVDCAYTLEYDDVEITNSCEGKTIERTWTAYFNNDPSDKKTCVQKITLVAPVLTNCPNDVVFDCSETPIYNWQAPTIIGECGGIVVQTSGPESGSIFPVGTTTITYQIEDGCGATQTCSFTVTVKTSGSVSDLEINCPSDYSGCIEDASLPSITGTPTVTLYNETISSPDDISNVRDNSNCAFKLDYTDNVIESSCSGKKIERTWSVYFVDNPNERKTCTQIITLATPALTNCPNDVVFDCSETPIYNWQAPTIIGDCGGTVVQTSGPESGSLFPVGTTTITYKIEDGCGAAQTCSFTVTVKTSGSVSDLEINCPSDYSGCIEDASLPSVTGTPTVTLYNETISSPDDISNVADNSNCAYKLDYTDEVIESSCSGKKIKRTWSVYFVDNPSERKTCTQIITLATPALTNCQNDVVFECGETPIYNWQAPTVIGECGGTVVQTSGPESGSLFPVGTTTIIYKIENGCGEAQTCSFTVTVKTGGSVSDLEINCPSDYSGCIGDVILPSVTGTPTATLYNETISNPGDISNVADNSNCEFELDYTDEVLESNCSGKKIKRTWSVYFVDNPSERKTCTQIITLATPTLTDCPSDVVLSCTDNPTYTWQAPTVIGACGGTVVQTSGPASGSVFPTGTTTITYEVGTGCGDRQTCSFTVTVNTGQASDLTITCPSDFSSCAGQPTDPSTTGTPTVTTTNTGCPYILDYSDIVLADGCASKTIQRTWFVYYENNPNERKTCTQTITVDGLTLTNCPSDVVLDCGEETVYTWQPPTGVGSCGSCSDVVEVADFLYMGERGGHRYYCSRTKATWHEAKAIAESMNGYLAVIDDPAENALFAGFLVNQFAHIGLTDEGTEGNFRWINGAPLNFTNWRADQPNNHQNKQHYGQMVIDGQWNDGDGSEVLEYIVEVPCAEIRQTSGPQNGSVFPDGTTTITYEIGDGCGVTETCSFTVTVQSSITVECPNDVILDCDNSQNGANYAWTPPTASSCCNDCPAEGADIAGFVYMGSYNGHQYYCSKEKANWQTAKAESETAGGYLAVINDTGENELLANFLTEQSAFIGLHDLNQEGTFEWVNGEAVAYKNWYPGQPNNYRGSQDVVRLLKNGQWDDTYASVELEYIMEIPCMSIQQIKGPENGSVFPVGTTDVAYLIKDACGNQEICDFKVTVNPCEEVVDYCESVSGNTNFFWIRHIVCGDINQVSTRQGGYSDYTNQQTDMQAGTQQTIILSPGFTQNRYYLNWRVWIDYNRDGDFEDANEEVLTYKHYNILKLKFTVPQQCGVGPTRMRVSMKYGTPANSCESFTYGEVEDYTVNLLPGNENLQKIVGINRTNNPVTVEIIEHESTAPISELGIGESTSLSIFPNPVSDNLNVELRDYDGQRGQLRIYNNLGQKVMEKDLNSAEHQNYSLSVGALTNGLYLLSIESENGITIIKKFNKH